MPGPIDIVYTTIGGVIGAAVTQYVTHVRDRRAARALVIERVADVEEAFTALRLALPENGSASLKSPIAAKLAALESACLIAGLPRSVLMCYTASIKHYDHAHRILQASKDMSEEIGRLVNENLAKLRESPNRDQTIASLKAISEGLRKLQKLVDTVDETAFVLHDAALRELGRALWHPLILQFHRRTLHKLQRSAEGLDNSGRDLARILRQSESLYSQTSRSRSNTKAVEGAPASDASPSAGES